MSHEEEPLRGPLLRGFIDRLLRADRVAGNTYVAQNYEMTEGQIEQIAREQGVTYRALRIFWAFQDNFTEDDPTILG